MIKMAMIRVQAALKKTNFKSRMIMQVHDELVFDALREEADELKALILEGMQAALPLPNNVPVIAEAGIGDNWLEAH
jgi:DNA polymerase-1